jgi:hypothetical protein
MSDTLWPNKADSCVELTDALDQYGCAASPLFRAHGKLTDTAGQRTALHREDEHKDEKDVTQSSGIRGHVAETGS